MRAIAPGKIIISGEHAVVYGTPALAVAVDIHACCQVRTVPGRTLALYLDDLHAGSGSAGVCLAEVALDELENFRQTVDKAYQCYLQGKLDITGVLTEPGGLYLYAVAGLLASNPQLAAQGMAIHLHSDIPIGSGMGSSAATVAAVLAAVAGVYDLPLSKTELFQLTSRAERLQHGCNSTIDPMVTVHGGLVRIENAEVQVLSEVPDLNWYLVNSGVPEVSTGQCVAEVRRRFGASAVWKEFHGTVTGLEQALVRGDSAALKEYVRRNHRLLVDIGVVPGTVQKFIDQLQARYNAVGKISGAGAVLGEKAGFVLVQSDKPIDALCDEYGFSVTRLQCDPYGVRLC